jgi:hypothetical protein
MMQQLHKAMSGDCVGFYNQIRDFNESNGVSVSPMEYFAAKARDEWGVAPEEALLARREAHYLRKFGVKEWELDRAERVRQYAADSWPLERYWADQGCPMRGPAAPSVEKAFTTVTGLQGTFPIFFDQSIREGTLATSILDDLVAEQTTTNSGVANHTELADPGSSSALLTNIHPLQEPSEIGEGTRLTQITVTFRERQIPLKEFGFEVLSSYQAVRRTRLPVLQRTLARVGRNFQNFLADFAIDVLVLGDSAVTPSGTAAPSNAATTVAAGVAGAPVYADYVNLDLGFPQGYSSVKWIANKEAIIKMLNISEFKDPLAFQFTATGNMPTPLGKRLIRWDTTGRTTAWPNTATNCKILVMSDEAGLIQYTEGGIISETENIIAARWTRLTYSVALAFALGDPSQRIVGTGFA